LAWAILILGRLIELQVFQHHELALEGQRQQEKIKSIPSMRGAILTRDGQTLAKSLPAWTLYVNPKQAPDPGVTADLIASVLNLDHEKLAEAIRSGAARDRGYLRVARKLREDQVERIRKLNPPGAGFETDTVRLYPQGRLAAHVLGSV